MVFHALLLDYLRGINKWYKIMKTEDTEAIKGSPLCPYQSQHAFGMRLEWEHFVPAHLNHFESMAETKPCENHQTNNKEEKKNNMEVDASKYACAISSSSECGKSFGETKPVPHIRRTNNMELWWWTVPNRSSTRKLSIRECEQYVQAKKKTEKRGARSKFYKILFSVGNAELKHYWSPLLPAWCSCMCQLQEACREAVDEQCWKHVHFSTKSSPYGLLSSPVISYTVCIS